MDFSQLGTWADRLPLERFESLFQRVELAYDQAEIYPPREQLFSAFALTPPEAVRAVILGQDPYHEPGQAHGLAFSVQPGVKAPPSLVNIYKERESDLGILPSPDGNLTAWAKQGVLLLNTVLTVERGRANSHRLQPDDYNLEGIARYICKLPAGGRQWAASRNLKPPEVRYPRHRVSRRRAAEIARDAEAAQEAVKKQFPGLRVLRVEAKISDYCAGAYIYACMRKEETHEPDGRAAHGRGGGAGGGLPGRTAQRTRKRGGDPAGQKDQGA